MRRAREEDGRNMGRSWRWMEGSGQASLIDIRLDTWDPPSRDIGVWNRPLGPLTRSGHTHPLAFFKELVREFPVESFPEQAHPLAGTGTTWGPNTTAPVGSV